MFVAVIGVNHRTAPVEIREKLAVSKAQIQNRADEFQGLNGVEGVVILSTCNRTEFYLTARDPEEGKKALLAYMAHYAGCGEDTILKHSYQQDNGEAVYHLFRVAAGLDSMLLGESQILGQVEEAYNWARDYKISNNVLNTLFQKAIEVGKRVRTETLIDRQAVSVGSASVELAKTFFGSLVGRAVLVLGAGETSALTVRHLVANGISTTIVANRTYEKACQLAREFSGQAIRLAEFPRYLQDTDIVISCTAAPVCIVKKEDVAPVMEKRRQRPLLFIDIAVPRDIHPGVKEIEGVSLYDVDDLQQVVEKNLAERKKEALKANLLVTEELGRFMNWLDSLLVVPTIKALRQKAHTIKEGELEKALRKLGNVPEKEKKIIGSLANSLVNKILYDPIANLKEYAPLEKGPLYMEAVRNLFNLEQEDKGQEDAL